MGREGRMDALGQFLDMALVFHLVFSKLVLGLYSFFMHVFALSLSFCDFLKKQRTKIKLGACRNKSKETC